ncbi:hypothetical protein HY797_01100 [Candidatus Falkowbacteria bacterium]|nr:hypothetical protein [Candidatus Falkowbacteria bacterium]
MKHIRITRMRKQAKNFLNQDGAEIMPRKYLEIAYEKINPKIWAGKSGSLDLNGNVKAR